MPSFESRRRILARAGGTLVFCVSLAGCLGGAPSASDETTRTTVRETTEETPATTATATETPVPFAEITNGTAAQRALAAEESYLKSQLQNASCLTSWGTLSTTGSKEVNVVNRTSDGIAVEVQHPYSYGKEDPLVEADGYSRATYLVTEERVERIAGREISPC
ncbi:hypothetical protein [Haloferax sp. DFSO60]|uniref:hypothetical protein n=1 Tax=Haloferax sp. DFSO60 TaxID=3388652 RepID=UPI00397B6F27